MLQQQVKDYLLRLIQEFFKKLQLLMGKGSKVNEAEKLSIINDCHAFFSNSFAVSDTDNSKVIIEKINNKDLLDLYAKLLFTELEVTSKNKEKLSIALELVEYLQNTDANFSWERTILQEDILRILDENNK
ncbi:MAG: hypothetical protein ACK5KT_07385 [Dysgonomonas sp.]